MSESRPSWSGNANHHASANRSAMLAVATLAVLVSGCRQPAEEAPPWVGELEARLRTLDWEIEVTPTSGPFYWGWGRALIGRS